VNFAHDGLSLWYGTSDAPAPGDAGVVPRRGATLIVGVHPANPTNALNVRYRIDGGREQVAPGHELRTDYDRQAQYFGVTFPELVTGSLVEYLPVLSCAGRQVPAANASPRFPSKFQLAPAAASTIDPTRKPQTQGAGERHFAAGLDFVASVALQFSKPQYVGDTPAGMRVNFFGEDGVVEGNGFKGKVIEHSSDHLLIRRDGMGVVHIRAAFATADGARLDVEAGGYADFGPDGYRRALAQDLPDRAPLVLTPLITTRHPRYRWLTRIQCVAVGYTNLHADRVSYCVYATSAKPVT
jgi:Protein of unknown function (DUF3237)